MGLTQVVSKLIKLIKNDGQVYHFGKIELPKND